MACKYDTIELIDVKCNLFRDYLSAKETCVLKLHFPPCLARIPPEENLSIFLPLPLSVNGV